MSRKLMLEVLDLMYQENVSSVVTDEGRDFLSTKYLVILNYLLRCGVIGIAQYSVLIKKYCNLE